MTVEKTETLRIGSAASAGSNWTPTWTGGDAVYAINQDLASPVDTRYAAMDCAAANDGQVLAFQLHTLLGFDIDLIKSFQIRVRYQFQNYTDDTVTVNANVKNGLGNNVGNSWSVTATNNSVATSTNTEFTFTGGSEPSRSDVDDYYIEFDVDVTESGGSDGIVFRLIGFEVDFTYDQDNTARSGPELLYVSEVSQEDTGYAGYSNGMTVTLPAGVNRKIIGIWIHEGELVSQASNFRYNSTSTNNSSYWIDMWEGSSGSSQFVDPGILVNYYDIPDADSGSKTIYYVATNNLSFTSVPVRFMFLIIGQTEAGDPGSNFGREQIGEKSGFGETTNDRTLQNGASDSPDFDNNNETARFLLTLAFSVGQGETGRWMFDFTDDGHRLICPRTTGNGGFGGETTDFELPASNDPILIGVRSVQSQANVSIDISRGSASDVSPAMAIWWRLGLPSPSLDTVDSDDIIVRGQGSATLDGDLDGAQTITMQDSGEVQTITAQTPTQLTFTFAQGNMKFGTNTCEVLVSTPGVPT